MEAKESAHLFGLRLTVKYAVLLIMMLLEVSQASKALVAQGTFKFDWQHCAHVHLHVEAPIIMLVLANWPFMP